MVQAKEIGCSERDERQKLDGKKGGRSVFTRKEALHNEKLKNNVEQQ